MAVSERPCLYVWRPFLPKQRLRAARVPDSYRVYAIGDIHGRLDLLDQLLKRIDANLDAFPAQRALHVFLGDYVDRGAMSRQVIDRLIERSRTHESIFLRGNHELLVDQFLREPSILGQWQRFGGLETLMSYGLTPSFEPSAEEQTRLAEELATAMPQSHRRFFDGLRSSFHCGDYFFVHAGVRPGLPLDMQSESDLLWIRDDFLDSDEDFGKVVVHGHTPVSEPEIRSNRINIDTGAYATGRLTCLVLEHSAGGFATNLSSRAGTSSGSARIDLHPRWPLMR